TGFNQGVTGPLRKLARGELTGGNAVGSANRQAALAKQAMRKIKGKGPAFTGSLNKSQKSEALALSKMGVPANIAAGIAKRKVSAGSVRGARNRFGGNVKYAAYRGRKGKSRSKILSFSGGGGLQGAKKRRSGSGFNYKKFMKKGGKKTPKGGKVLSFREKASRSNSAQISKDKSRSVFDIVSRRYMISGWGRLDVDR
ncbi:MAG: hypothetical protein KC493_05500, partial [Bacteriovoracaceae bacterium]|nr:hypothetical protein [Bacteriovoracaceae bacterium]